VKAPADLPQAWPPHAVAEVERGSRLAAFGRETRYVSRIYCQRIILFMAVTLTIVLSLDVATNLNSVMSDRSLVSDLEGPARLATYTLMRAGYVLPSIVPIAVFIGILWAEFSLTVSRERIMIANSGRLAMHAVFPAAIVGLSFGLIQHAALGYGRPASVEAQSVANFRYYGPKFRPNASLNSKWIALEGAVVNARIEFTSPIALGDAVIYWIDKDGQLAAVVSAVRVTPAPNLGRWTFEKGTVSEFSPAAPGGADLVRKANFDHMERPLPLNPLWVENIDISPLLLPQKVLGALAFSRGGVPKQFSYRTAYHERFAAILYATVMAMAAASLSLMRFSPDVPWHEPLKIGMCWFGVHVSSSMLIVLGAHGYVSSLLAAWFVPSACGVGVLLLLYRHDRGRTAATRGRGPFIAQMRGPVVSARS
jgi:lipopolysaccharide export LptBFGC system permease protein LptF